MDPAVDSLFALMLERMERSPGFDPDSFFAEHAIHAEELRARLSRLRAHGMAPDTADSANRLRLVRERFGVPTCILPGSGARPPASQAGQELLPSRVIGGRYQILAEIGRGGMGRVFRALDIDLSREVALKVTDLDSLLDGLPEAQREAWIRRFFLEAQVTSQLEHPSIVPVHDIGVDRSGQLYYTMKLVEGVTLAEKIDEWHRGREAGRPFPTPELLRIVIQTCRALAYAHERGILHRDLKPANVMIGRFGEVQVMDWGLAKRLDESCVVEPLRSGGHRREGSTLAGEVLGTITHMAPEQARGEVSALGSAVDVYGLGAILHHGLYGVPPNRLDGQRGVTGQRSSPVLDAICERALSHSPEARYSSASQLADDLQAVLDNRAVGAFQAGALVELRMWVLRNRGAALSAGLAVAIAVASLSILLLMNERLSIRDEEVTRLSVSRDVDVLEREAAELWPVSVEHIPAYESWIERARLLLDGLPSYRDSLHSLEGDQDRRSLWQASLLEDLIARLDAIESGLMVEDFSVPGLGFSVPLRLQHARRIRAGFAAGGEVLHAWEGALPALRAAYPGVEIEPQLGLMPLGPDPESHLWEFADLLSGSVPSRNAEGKLLFDGASSIVFVLIPPGEFLMGAQSTDPDQAGYCPDANANEAPPHRVRVSAFLLSKFELTQAQWWRLRGENPSQYGPNFYFTPAMETHPVETVSWTEATETLMRIGALLPSEAQWQHACRGNHPGIWGPGDDPPLLAEVANLADQFLKDRKWQGEDGSFEAWNDGHATSAPVGSYRANAFGLFDMHGNVAEWCLDDFAAYPADRAELVLDPLCVQNTSSTKVFMGGGWPSMSDQARTSARPSEFSYKRSGAIGIRPTRPLSTEKVPPFVNEKERPKETPDNKLWIFLSKGGDPEPERAWREAVGEYVREDFSGKEAGTSLDHLKSDGVSVEMTLRSGGRTENVVQVFQGLFGDQPFVSGNALIFRADDDCPPMEELQLQLSPPVRGIGFWLFDDYGPDVTLLVDVTLVDGLRRTVTMSPPFSAGLEGFFGCLSDVKVDSVAVRMAQARDFVFFDGLKIAK